MIKKYATDLTREFIEKAQGFEKSRILELEKSRKIAWRLVVGFGAIALSSVIAVAMIAPLKTVEPFIVRVDNNTGLTDTVSYIKNQDLAADEVMNKYFLSQYVNLREGYDWHMIQATYDATMLFSSRTIKDEFAKLYERTDAPHKILKDQAKVLVKVNAITFIGDIAQVRFEKTVEPTGRGDGMEKHTSRWIASIAYGYENKPARESDRLINPLGFQVNSYRVDPESA
jgi:type IV secretion system protein VirB8